MQNHPGYYIVVGISSIGHIGADNNLLFECKQDLKHFYKITTSPYPEGTQNILIMGYNTWMSLPENVKPFSKRLSIVVSRNHTIPVMPPNLVQTTSLEDAFTYASTHPTGRIFVIGGEQIYKRCYTHHMNHLRGVYATCYQSGFYQTYKTLKEFPCEILNTMTSTYTHTLENIPVISRYEETPKTESMNLVYRTLQSPTMMNHNELSYLKLLKKVMTKGTEVDSRNSRVKSLFGERMEFDLSQGFPLLTTKQMGYKTILRELLWFMSGSTDNRILKSQNVHIWNQNASREFLDSRGLSDNPVDDLGPVYGFQWRHFGAEYTGYESDYTNQGVDQIKEILRLIREEPTSRRILLSAWNPSDLHKMALPPCHVMCQFHVDTQKQTLDCQLYQRSGDMFLGVPFNIASYSFVTHIIAHLSGLTAGRLIHILGDAHIYENHYPQVNIQMERLPIQSPTIKISSELKSLDDLSEEKITLHGYQSYPKLVGIMTA